MNKDANFSNGLPRPIMESYYLGSRDDLMRLIPAGTRRILEIGCAAGMTGRKLKELGYEEVVGVELMEDMAQRAEPFYDRVFVGDVEKIRIPYERGYFDCILYGDVLEHLNDPWRLLRQHNAFLPGSGTIICSIPNVRYYKITKKLLMKGEWEYRDRGVLDRTHLRFFTVNSIREMIEDAGFEIVLMIKRPSGAKWLKWLNRVFFNCIVDHLVLQYVVVAIKKYEV